MLKELDSLLAADAGEILKEVIQGVASLQVVEEGTYGNPRPNEDGCSGEDLRMDLNHRIGLRHRTSRVEAAYERNNSIRSYLLVRITASTGADRYGGEPLRPRHVPK